MRIGLFGGTFDPVHNGHISLASQAKSNLKLDKVIFVPAYIPVHKDSEGIVDAEDRLSMIELAIEASAGLEVSSYEINRREKIYSIEILQYFREISPSETEIFFLTGADSLTALDAWKDLDKILMLCKFIVFSRPGFLRANEIPGVTFIDIDEVDISSTQIRENLSKGNPISELVPFQVADYIAKKNLYKHPR